MIKIVKKINLMAIMLVLMLVSTLNVYAAVLDKGEGQTLILNQKLGIVGSRTTVEVFGTRGGGTVSCISESTYSRAYQAYPEDGWVFIGWATAFDGIIYDGSNGTIGLTDDWLFSKVGDKETEFNQYGTTIQANFELGTDMKIYAIFKPTIKVSAGANGYHTGEETVVVNYNGSYSVKYVPNKGYEISNVTADLYNSVSLTDADRAGYTYTFTNVTDKHTISGSFRPIEYKIAFNGNGATSGSMDVQTFTYDKTQALSANEYKKAGYKFEGWNTKADGTGENYTNMQEVKNLTSTKGETITLYAKWSAEKLTGNVEITGTLKYGETLTLVVTDTNNTGTLKYEWLRDDTVITGASDTSYVLDVEDIGKKITCKVTSTVQTGNISDTTEVIDKADGPEAPIGLEGIAPTSTRNDDGKITCTTENMEYADNIEFIEAIGCVEVETGGLSSGIYYVRIAETATHKAGAYTEVEVPEFIAPNIEGTGEAVPDDTPATGVYTNMYIALSVIAALSVVVAIVIKRRLKNY